MHAGEEVQCAHGACTGRVRSRPPPGLGDVAREHNSSARLSRKANRTQRRHLRFLFPLY